MMLCLSHKTTISYVEKLGSNHDSEVLKWRDQLKTKVASNVSLWKQFVKFFIAFLLLLG